MKTLLKLYSTILTKGVIHHRFWIAVTIASNLFVCSFFLSQNQQLIAANKVLGERTNNVVIAATPAPSPTLTPSPTPVPKIRNFSSSPNPTPTPSPAPAPTPTPALVASTDQKPQEPSPTPESTPAPSPSPQPSPQASTIEIEVDYSPLSEKPIDTYIANFAENQTAWTVVSSAIGLENLEYTDYGGDLGVFITGINGVVPVGNNFWLFRVNGQDSNVGVNSYIVQEHDKLEFAISSF